MMNSRQRVLAAYAHEDPDCVPRWCGASPEFLAKAGRELGIESEEGLRLRFGDDFRRVSARYVGPEVPLPAAPLAAPSSAWSDMAAAMASR